MDNYKRILDGDIRQAAQETPKKADKIKQQAANRVQVLGNNKQIIQSAMG